MGPVLSSMIALPPRRWKACSQGAGATIQNKTLHLRRYLVNSRISWGTWRSPQRRQWKQHEYSIFKSGWKRKWQVKCQNWKKWIEKVGMWSDFTKWYHSGPPVSPWQRPSRSIKEKAFSARKGAVLAETSARPRGTARMAALQGNSHGCNRIGFFYTKGIRLLKSSWILSKSC